MQTPLLQVCVVSKTARALIARWTGQVAGIRLGKNREASILGTRIRHSSPYHPPFHYPIRSAGQSDSLGRSPRIPHTGSSQPYQTAFCIPTDHCSKRLRATNEAR